MMVTGWSDIARRAFDDALPGRVSTRAADLNTASHDASAYPGVRPDAIVWPETTAEVAAVVRIARTHRVPLTPRGAGSSLEGNPIPVAGGIVLDCTRMHEVVAVRPDDAQVDVQPGVVYATLNRALGAHGLFFPPAPGGSAEIATIGGMVANNASGIYSVKYGGVRDHVRAATVVTGAGEILRLGDRCRKSASGYHLLGLLIGSEGTLAIATEITLALAGLPVGRRRGGFRFDEPVAAARATAVLRYGLDVAAIEFLDAPTIAALNRFGSFGLEESPCLLLEVHGSDAVLAETWRSVEELMAGEGGAPLALDDPWSIRERATRAIEAQRPGAITVRADVAIPIGALPTLVAASQAIAATHGVVAHVFGHAGIGILHVLVLADPAEELRAGAARRALLERTLELGGAVSGEHGMGLGNRDFAARALGPALGVMQQIKRVFDPDGILNPGKIW
jgi:D-lactate dehydrogenase (cytochrome)